MSELALRQVAAILCDDVRTEDNGKQFLIGVYSGDIVVSTLPSTLALSVWLNAEVISGGKAPIKVEFQLDSEERLSGSITGEIGSVDVGGFIGVGFPKLPVTIAKPSVLKVRWKVGAGAWKTAIEKRIRVGSVNAAAIQAHPDKGGKPKR